MSLKRFGSTLFSVLGLLTLVSCGTREVQRDMDEWCTCRKETKSNDVSATECDEMMEKILQKYEFDPEASEIVVKRIMDCSN